MYIVPISKNDNSKQMSFNGIAKPVNQYINSKNIETMAEKITGKEGTPNLLKNLSVLAASIAAEFAIFIEKNEEIKNVVGDFLKNLGIEEDNTKSELNIPLKDNSEKEISKTDIDKLVQDKPERNVYLKMTSYFPNLDKQYKQLLNTHINEPENEKNNFVLSSIENIFGMFSSSNESLMYMKPYMDVLNNKYSNCLDGIAKNLESTVLNGNSPMYYLVLLRNEKISEEEIRKWAKNSNLGCDEFMLARELSEDAIERLSKLKETNTGFKITKIQPLPDDRFDIPVYILKLEFIPEDLALPQCLKAIANVHEAIYGGIYLTESKDTSDEFLITDIQTELVDNILKDRRMDATYNFVKYIEPSALEEFNYTSDEIKFLPKENEDYPKIKDICSRVLMNMNSENPKLEAFCDTLNDDEIFTTILATRHSRIRFITRFVLKDNYNPKNLRKKTEEKLNTLFNELKPQLESCNFYCYMHPKGTAPQFYIRNSKLGNFVKVTLNSEGSIHTIYEDFKKERKLKGEENPINTD